MLIILINKLPLCFNIKHIIVQIKNMHFVSAFHLYTQDFTMFVTAATVQNTEKPCYTTVISTYGCVQ